MIRTFKYPLYPTKSQAAILLDWVEACRQLYNGALEHRIGAYKKGNSVTKYEQFGELTDLRQSDPYWKSVPSEIERSALKRLDKAYASFFRRCKHGEKPGFPRFKGKGRYNSFSFLSRVEDCRVNVPKVGGIRFHLYRPIQGKIKETTLRFTNNRWYVCFSCELEDVPKIIPRTSIGIDLGLTHFLTLSNGSTIDNPRFLKVSEDKLAQRQRILSRKTRGSNNSKKTRLLVSKIHERIKNQRIDFSRKLACELFSRYDLIAHEELSIRELVQGNLSKSINDASWGIFINCLTLKAENAGKWAVGVNPRGTTQKCSSCGEIVKKELKDRVHSCTCGLTLDRDHNAALNILAAGRAVPLKEKPMVTTYAALYLQIMPRGTTFES
jgi:putative transposase